MRRIPFLSLTLKYGLGRGANFFQKCTLKSGEARRFFDGLIKPVPVRLAIGEKRFGITLCNIGGSVSYSLGKEAGARPFAIL